MCPSKSHPVIRYLRPIVLAEDRRAQLAQLETLELVVRDVRAALIHYKEEQDRCIARSHALDAEEQEVKQHFCRRQKARLHHIKREQGRVAVQLDMAHDSVMETATMVAHVKNCIRALQTLLA